MEYWPQQFNYEWDVHSSYPSSSKSLVKLLRFLIILHRVVAHESSACRCAQSNEMSCHCEGDILDIYIPDRENLRILSLENGNFSFFFQKRIKYIKETLADLTITRSPKLDYINDNVFQGMPSLNYLRITHTSLSLLPQMNGLGMISSMRIIDLESNKIERIPENKIFVRTAQLALDYNSIKEIEGWAFNGSEIEKLSLKGNRDLAKLSTDSFNGITSLRDLDLSETSITFLPIHGLENLEILTIMDTYTLKVIPSIYDLSKLQFAHLTYSFHCCAFHNPEKHNPEKHEEYMKMKRKFCTDQNRLERDMFGEIMEHNESLFKNDLLHKEGRVEDGVLEENQYEGFTDETFHQTSADVQKIKLHAVCGNLAGKFVACLPKPDALNPCEDMLSWTWLTTSVWFVLSTAIFGNILVLVVLCLSRTEKSVPRYLMCHLAIADLMTAIYLAMLAIMDTISSKSYFNYAYDWQTGVGCKIAGFLTVFASQLSLFTLSLLTVERWFAIRHALYLNMLDLKLTGIFMLFGWIYSISMASLPLFGVSSYSSTSICLPMDTHNIISEVYIIVMVFIGGCSFLLMCICYIQIYNSLSEETRHSIGEGSVARKMTILVGINFACWAPVAFFTLTAVAGYPLITVSQSKILLVFIYPINSCANPYLYAILTQQFRKDVVTIISRWFNRKESYRYKLGHTRPAQNDTLNDTRAPVTTAETVF